MKINTEYPYNDYVGYIVTNSENRKNLCLVHKVTKKRTTIAYARYLMSVKEARVLTKLEEVDHIDGNKTNDVLNNLQIVSKVENIKKSRIERGISRKMIRFICDGCGEVHVKYLNQSHLQKGNKFTSCSKKCLIITLGKKHTNAELEAIGNKQILEHFNK
jgi:hypothetical protein